MIATPMALEPAKHPSHRATALAAARVVCLGVFTAIVMMIYGAACLILLPSRRLRVRLSGSAGHLIGRVGLKMLGVRLRIDHPDRLAHPAIYVCNHTSMLDVLIAVAVAPSDVCFVARRGLLLLPFVGVLYALSGHLLIPRARSSAAVAALQKIAGFVRREGFGLFIWPEGTRSANGRLRSVFKKGFVHMAIDTGLPVVPLVCVGAHRALPKGQMLPAPGEVVVKVLDTISTGGWERGSVAEHCEEVRRLMSAALPEGQRGDGRPSGLPWCGLDVVGQGLGGADVDREVAP